MPLYVTISRGPRADRADRARPIVAITDRAVVGAVLQTLARLDEWEDGDDGDVRPFNVDPSFPLYANAEGGGEDEEPLKARTERGADGSVALGS